MTGGPALLFREEYSQWLGSDDLPFAAFANQRYDYSLRKPKELGEYAAAVRQSVCWEGKPVGIRVGRYTLEKLIVRRILVERLIGEKTAGNDATAEMQPRIDTNKFSQQSVGGRAVLIGTV